MILHNGPVYTMDPRLPQVRALSVAGDTIAGGVDVQGMGIGGEFTATRAK